MLAIQPLNSVATPITACRSAPNTNTHIHRDLVSSLQIQSNKRLFGKIGLNSLILALDTPQTIFNAGK